MVLEHSKTTNKARPSRDDLDQSPVLVFYEVTQACDLACTHCRASAQPLAHPDELNLRFSRLLINQLAEFPQPPTLVVTGGDPLKRADIFELVEHAAGLGIKVAATPSATPLVTRDALQRLRKAGMERMAVSLDGLDAATHDGVRGVCGSFARTLEILRDARELQIPLQINTTVMHENLAQLDALAELLAEYEIVLWSIFFLVPVGRATSRARLTPEQYEEVFALLWRQANRRQYAIKTTEAPHYRRYVQMRRLEQRGGAREREPGSLLAPRTTLGLNDGKGIMFVNHAGLIFPSGFMPITCGAFPFDSVVQVYQQSPIFRALRDARLLKGKCGACEYRNICGGSRARSLALLDDPLGSEPDCVYIPPTWQGE